MPLGFTTKSLDFGNIGFNPSGLIKKASLVNLDTNETYKFLFNPTEIRRTVRPQYAQKNVMFRSSSKWQYRYTESPEWRFTLYLHSTSSGAQSIINILPLSRNLNQDTAFLDSLCFPLEGSGLDKRRPPKVRFVWPKLANVPVIVTEVSTTFQKFNFLLQQQMTTVEITLREDHEKIMTSNMIRQAGSTGIPGLLGSVLDAIPGASSVVSSIASII